MVDEKILLKIEGLVDEEKTLREDETSESAERLVHVEETLDHCWDLLRRRRALREFGQDPDDATVRDSDTVEEYLLGQSASQNVSATVVNTMYSLA